ncbi:MAG: DNA repair protein RecO, partial [Gemmatimonadetes bacterium]|nr:DNA repair protein RecO [Gemmatimonadota bacterium]
MAVTTTDAVLLRAHAYGETSRVLRFLTRDRGIVGVMARGVRSTKRG